MTDLKKKLHFIGHRIMGSSGWFDTDLMIWFHIFSFFKLGKNQLTIPHVSNENVFFEGAPPVKG